MAGFHNPIGAFRRKAVYKNGNYILTEEMENQLTKVGFIWEPYNKYNFENSIIAVANYYKEFGKYPSQHSQDCKVKRLGAFVVQLRQNMRKDNFPEWKNALIKKYVPDFSCEHNNIVALKRFLHYARLYKKENGHLNIKINDVVGDDYRIGIIFSAMRQKYKNGQFKNSEVRQIEELGLYLGSKFNKQYNEKMECARQAVRDGVKINVDNQFYNKINLYTWIKSTINKKYKNGELSDEENLIIEKLIDKPLGKFFNNGTYVKVVDVINKEEISICKSRSDVSRIVQNVYGFKLSDESIRNRLSGKVTTPYKGRFMFYYATDEEVKKYLEDGKQDNSKEGK